ncbi:DUF2911 domain-containing protein [Reichenbachiella carrageenanivorans]|uniref:DUF2911 domain-containing protein n=1 Tax=Reichenbachiella carrageenanivorans TaxID=2979869 RepID=A0ABY6D151_9BACT|nr:DUF2911 domain-containing protein [Reichenbachiella carrageenanivorans]UXX78793.1 DUF2911 domain-containing protein [Reichenbachiella carrageenanivorans]
MIKKIIIAIVVAVVGYFAYGVLTTRSHSPLTTAEGSSGDLSVSVDYCQPYKKGRLIFGEASEEALVPYGKYWRLGANDATEITFSHKVNFAGKAVAAGRYRMYAVPNTDHWEVSLNSQLGEFGYFEPDYTLDVVKVQVPVQDGPTGGIEQLTMAFDSDSTGLLLNIAWDETMVSVPIAQQ